jgi:hypothetical protein
MYREVETGRNAEIRCLRPEEKNMFTTDTPTAAKIKSATWKSVIAASRWGKERRNASGRMIDERKVYESTMCTACFCIKCDLCFLVTVAGRD